MFIWVFSFYCHGKFSEEAHVRLEGESLDAEAVNFIGRNLGLVLGVEEENKGKQEDSDEEEKAIAATHALKATTA